MLAFRKDEFLHAEQEHVEALQSSKPGLAQLQTKSATAAAPEEASLVDKARALSLERAELKSAEVALQALCTQRQQGESGIAMCKRLLQACILLSSDLGLVANANDVGPYLYVQVFHYCNLLCLQSSQDTSKSAHLTIYHRQLWTYRNII